MEVTMPTFAPPTPLTRQITYVWQSLQRARREHDEFLTAYCEKRLDELIDRLPRSEPAQE
ncbi:hypothetical protein VC60_gp82 [Mycobacterium phage Sbash]|uniref:Uncharacterized protein n=1 Tax=Mycobacterium phage Sbash TaxID=1567475 RepID=A0A0A7RW13_9CAUD|nr:hypothetical protein VC60_gp82 [Mycobacterium phage Sbash]AJA43383.1 hypothetical protein PBI_SBASH_82 [Mycobacterium phage Sbash]